MKTLSEGSEGTNGIREGKWTGQSSKGNCGNERGNGPHTRMRKILVTHKTAIAVSKFEGENDGKKKVKFSILSKDRQKPR